jgi:purine operon repressor
LALRQTKDGELRERLLVVDLLRELKNIYTYKQLSSLLGIQESLLCRYVNGVTVPSEVQYNNIINKVKNKEFLLSFIKNRIRIFGDGFIDTSSLLFYPNLLRLVIELTLRNLPKIETVTKVFGIASNGIPFASMVATVLDKPLIIAKKHKDTLEMEYYDESIKESEGVVSSLYLRKDLISKTDKVIIVDDVIKSGRTIMASNNLLKKAGSEVALAFAIVSKREALDNLLRTMDVISLLTL